MSYFRDVWSVAAWDDELKPGALFSRRLPDEAVVLFRDAGAARLRCSPIAARIGSCRCPAARCAATRSSAPTTVWNSTDLAPAQRIRTAMARSPRRHVRSPARASSGIA
jgi:hypothetical protein